MHDAVRLRFVLARLDAGVQLDPIAAAMAFRARLAHEQHPFVISKMIKELGRVGGPADVELVAAQLGHPDARVRANAIEGLALLGGETLYERLKPLMEDAAPRVQATAAKVIYAIDRDRAFRKLKAMIASRESAVSDAAVHALGDVHDAFASPTEPPLEALLSAIRSRYTMEDERRMFDVMLSHLPEAPPVVSGTENESLRGSVELF